MRRCEQHPAKHDPEHTEDLKTSQRREEHHDCIQPHAVSDEPRSQKLSTLLITGVPYQFTAARDVHSTEHRGGSSDADVACTGFQFERAAAS